MNLFLLNIFNVISNNPLNKAYNFFKIIFLNFINLLINAYIIRKVLTIFNILYLIYFIILKKFRT